MHLKFFFFLCQSYQFNQHLMDSLCLQILELDALALVEHERSDGEAMDEQVSYMAWGGDSTSEILFTEPVLIQNLY